VVRSSVTIGERSASKAPWLLLLELLQLQGREKDFEETAMDYCITYEVSPPSFEAQARSATAATDLPAASDRFMLPAIVTGDARALLAAIANYAGAYDPIVLDCSRLLRIDYPCAAALHEQLRGFAGAGRTIELRDLNHLVAALFRLLGVADCARLFPHKY
jgi:ABC-type transporter Mla MlaB component